MFKSIAQKVFRREFLLVVFVFFLLISIPMDFYSQEFSETTISNNGIIETRPREEKVSDEDVQRINELNKDSALEYEIEEYETSETDEAEADDDFNSLFEEDADTEVAVQTPTTETVKVDPKNKPITFSGSLSAELGGYVWLEPWEETKPLATFTNTLKFVGRPATDFFVVGSLRTSFPEMVMGVYELYFDYTLLGLVDVAAGKRDVSWSISRMLDTNILDDEASKITNPEDVFNKKERTADDSKFFLTVNVPIFSYGSVQGLAYYFPYTTDIVGENIAMAGKVEGTLGKFSLSILGMRWPTNDSTRMNPALGCELVSSILGKESNLFAQGIINFDSSSEHRFNRARGTAGIYKYFPNPVMLGLAFEYQIIWDEDDTIFGTGKNYQQYYAAQIAWSHFIFGKKWTFGVEWFHDTGREYGSLLPVIKLEDVIKYTDLRFAVPIYYGSEKKYGLVFEAIINLDY